jgi:hypothetical protein
VIDVPGGVATTPPAFLLPAEPGGDINLATIDVAGLGLPIEWLVPSLVVTVPGVLLILAVLAQGAGAMLWLPYVRRTLGGDKRRRATGQLAR